MENFDKIVQVGIKKAIQHYWKTRTGQLKPGRRGGKVRDRGKRAEVTGGKQLDGFLWVVRDLLKEAGIADAQVFTGQIDSYLPGYFRPTKRWDLLAIADSNLLACIEVKSHAGPSYGNNFNNPPNVGPIKNPNGGLPVFLVLTKCDLLARAGDSPADWMDRIEQRKAGYTNS